MNGESDETELLRLGERLSVYMIPLVRQMSQATSTPLSPIQTSMLGTIYRHGPLLISEVASRENVTLPTTSRAIAQIEELGFIERIYDREDRRRCRVQITAEGLRHVRDNRKRRGEWLAERLAKLDAAHLDELGSLVNVLALITDEWNSVDPDAIEQDIAERENAARKRKRSVGSSRK